MLKSNKDYLLGKIYDQAQRNQDHYLRLRKEGKTFGDPVFDLLFNFDDCLSAISGFIKDKFEDGAPRNEDEISEELLYKFKEDVGDDLEAVRYSMDRDTLLAEWDFDDPEAGDAFMDGYASGLSKAKEVVNDYRNW
jgi:hypothetical protein